MFNFDKIVSSLKDNKHLSKDESFYISEKMFEGSLSDSEIKEILILLNDKGISTAEVVGLLGLCAKYQLRSLLTKKLLIVVALAMMD